MTPTQVKAVTEGVIEAIGPEVLALVQRENIALKAQVADYALQLDRLKALEPLVQSLSGQVDLLTKASVAGRDGAPGQPGPQGERGETGPAGVDGAPGATGEKGEPGERGSDGAHGAAGRDGVDGRHGEAGEKGLDGTNGRDGVNGQDGIGLAGAVIDRNGALVVTMTDGAAKALGVVVGGKGDAGRDGTNGRDGFGFEDLSVEHDGERTFSLVFQRGEERKSFSFSVPVMLYRGVFRDGKAYEPGDTVTWGNHVWAATQATSMTPGTGPESAKAWSMVMRRGDQGKAGPTGPTGPMGARGEVGPQGRSGY